MWELMVLAVKVTVGGFLWVIAFIVLSVLLSGVAYLANKIKG